VTLLLKAWRSGDARALDQLTPIVYADLHRIARSNPNRERDGHPLQPSGLINEAFIRLLGGTPVDWEDRTHFFSLFSRVMRQVLVDLARADLTHKRGSGTPHVGLSAAVGQPGDLSGMPVSFIDLDAALEDLARLDARRASVVELRYFGGLENSEIATVLGISESTVMREWRLARAWLYSRLQPRQKRQPVQ